MVAVVTSLIITNNTVSHVHLHVTLIKNADKKERENA